MTDEQNKTTGFADGLMRMNQKGAFKRMRLTRRRAEILLAAFKDVIYYLPDCHCDDENDCHCHDDYYAGIHWIKNTIFRAYPDLSEFKNPSPVQLFPVEKLGKKAANGLRDCLTCAEHFFDTEEANRAHEWAVNLIYKRYSIFELANYEKNEK